MKKLLTAGLLTLSLSAAVSAAIYEPVDQAFVDQAAAMGLSQSEWDLGEHSAASFPNAYKFTRSYEISRGLLGSGKGVVTPEHWKNTNELDLSKLKGYDADGQHDLITLLRDRLKNHSMVVLQGNEVKHQHFWNGMDENSTHLDMSVTKSFTSMLAQIAVAQGKIDMSKKVKFYLPELADSAFANATIQEVSDMRSGVEIPVPHLMSWDPRMTQSQEWNGKNDSGLHGVKAYAKLVTENKYPAGKAYQYQCINTEILGMVVEKVTGKKLADLLESQIWQEMGAENDAHWMSDPSGFVVASGGLNMTTRDLARVGKMIVNDGKNYLGEQIIPKAFIENLWKGNDEVRSAWKYGKEHHLAPVGWYKDQFRFLTIGEHELLAMVGINGQTMVIDKKTKTVIAMNGGYPVTETPRMAILLFTQIIPAVIEALENK